MGNHSPVTDEAFRQFIVYWQRDGDLWVYSVKVFVVGSLVGKLVAQHKNLAAVRQAIPATHAKADVAVVAPVVEVWIDKRIADA